MQPLDIPDSDKTKHKFMVQSLLVPEGHTNNVDDLVSVVICFVLRNQKFGITVVFEACNLMYNIVNCMYGIKIQYVHLFILVLISEENCWEAV